jgi:ornithine cyclodeaminase/alanine dehydrogenase
VECIRRVHKIKELRVCDIFPAAREKFASYFPDADFPIVPYETNEAGCRGADVSITLTTANATLVEEAWCKPGCLVMPMGSFHEISDDICLNFQERYLDNIAQGMHRGQFLTLAHDGRITDADFAAELIDVAAGTKPGRKNATDRIVCQLVGMGSPDLAVATLAYNRIMESGEDVPMLDMMG